MCGALADLGCSQHLNNSQPARVLWAPLGLQPQCSAGMVCQFPEDAGAKCHMYCPMVLEVQDQDVSQACLSECWEGRICSRLHLPSSHICVQSSPFYVDTSHLGLGLHSTLVWPHLSKLHLQ